MTIEQMRFMFSLISEALTKLVQGGEDMDRLTEVFLARGGVEAVNQLLVDNPDFAAEIQDFQELISNVTPIVVMLNNGLMKINSPERSVLMEHRSDA